MMHYLSQNAARIDSSEIRKLFDLAKDLKEPIDLSIGQPDFPVPVAVKEAMIKAVRDDKNFYTQTQGILPLREALCEKWQAEQNISIQPEHVLVSAGVASILYLLFEALFDEGDELLLIDPSFVIYPSLAKMKNLKVRYLSEEFGESDIDELLEDSTFSPKAVVFATPSNPTGRILLRNQIEGLARYAEKTGALLVSDEIYQAFDYEGKFFSAASILPDQTISLGGFSKSHAMTGLRVGYMGVSAALSALLNKVAAMQQYSVVCASQPAQWAALEALKTPLDKEFALMKSRRDLTINALKGKVNYPSPDGAFYIFPEVPIDSREFVKEAIKRSLLVVPGHIFSQKPNHVRISYAQKDELLQKGLDIFLQLCGELGE